MPIYHSHLQFLNFDFSKSKNITLYWVMYDDIRITNCLFIFPESFHISTTISYFLYSSIISVVEISVELLKVLQSFYKVTSWRNQVSHSIMVSVFLLSEATSWYG